MSKASSKSAAVVVVIWFLLRVGYAQTLFPTRNPALTRVSSVVGDARHLCANDASNVMPECYEPDTRLTMELSSLGTRGEMIATVRKQTLSLLKSENSCSAWFEQVEPNVADVFRSLHYDIDPAGSAEIHSIRDNLGDLYFMHPWGAKSIENSGSHAFIQLNANGPFFISRTRVVPSDLRAAAFRIEAPQPVYIGPYVGATPEARLTIMLHELGHIVGRIPNDDLSWNGRSSENTREVLRHCKKEIREIARQDR
jgi:hypothetical protein